MSVISAFVVGKNDGYTSENDISDHILLNRRDDLEGDGIVSAVMKDYGWENSSGLIQKARITKIENVVNSLKGTCGKNSFYTSTEDVTRHILAKHRGDLANSEALKKTVLDEYQWTIKESRGSKIFNAVLNFFGFGREARVEKAIQRAQLYNEVVKPGADVPHAVAHIRNLALSNPSELAYLQQAPRQQSTGARAAADAIREDMQVQPEGAGPVVKLTKADRHAQIHGIVEKATSEGALLNSLTGAAAEIQSEMNKQVTRPEYFDDTTYEFGGTGEPFVVAAAIPLQYDGTIRSFSMNDGDRNVNYQFSDTEKDWGIKNKEYLIPQIIDFSNQVCARHIDLYGKAHELSKYLMLLTTQFIQNVGSTAHTYVIDENTRPLDGMVRPAIDRVEISADKTAPIFHITVHQKHTVVDTRTMDNLGTLTIPMHCDLEPIAAGWEFTNIHFRQEELSYVRAAEEGGAKGVL